MMDGIKRVFVGWDRPLLHSLRGYLLDERGVGEPQRFGSARDLSATTVVLPGARAGRRLLELLAALEKEDAVVPPRIMTLGSWVALGAASGAGTAGEAARLAAWVAALRGLGEHERRAVARVSDSADPDTPTRWLGIARLLDACHAELSGEALRFADVAARGPETPDFTDDERWTALARAQTLYRQSLRDAGLVDAHLEQLDRLERGEIDAGALCGTGGVVLAGITEMNAVARSVLSRLAARCVALVAAPADLADRFDAVGCVVPGAWDGVRLDIPGDAVIAADRPEDQAGAAWRVVESLTNRAAERPISADQITIGVPDAEVEERVGRLAGRLGVVPVRRAEGTPVLFTRPAKLLLAAADYVERRDFAAMAALVRHPDAERWIAAFLNSHGHDVKPDRWLGVLDEYQATHLHGRVDGAWLTDDPAERETLEMLHGAVSELLGVHAGGASLLDDSRRDPAGWCGRIWDVVRAVFSGWGVTGRSHKPRLEPGTHEACMLIQADLQELASLPASLGAELRLTPAEALRLVVQQSGIEAVPEHGESAAIDLVGWLELAADDAPWLIVTGMNEGRAPAGAGVDPLLPEGLRRTLGLRDRRSRASRDIFAASVMLHSRPEGRTVFIFGRRSGEGDPLTPSRLLMMGDEASLLRRVGQWTGEASSPNAGEDSLMIAHSDVSAFELAPALPRTGPDAPRMDEMSVSSFADYLASPLGFYLKHVLRLREVDDGGVELDALGFGTLIHEVLRKLGEAEIAESRDERRIADFLMAHLESAAFLLFGEQPRAEVWVQLEQARTRLRAFAHEQAKWASEGWRIVRTEWEPARRTAFLTVDDAPMYLRGRIDRIDVNDDGRWAVLDYKTGANKVEQRDACTKSGRWINPQLPLYRHLARGLAAELSLKGDPVLAWVTLPSRSADTKVVAADWTSADLAAADDVLAEVVRNVRLGRFHDPGDDPPGHGILGVLCGGYEREDADA